MSVRIARPLVLPLLVLGAVLLVTAGCGNKGKKSASPPVADTGSPGAKIFASAGCGGCHTLSAADATGKIGPNLDELRPNQERVERQVRSGGNGMPSFAKKLSADQIRQVATFVATSAGAGVSAG